MFVTTSLGQFKKKIILLKIDKISEKVKYDKIFNDKISLNISANLLNFRFVSTNLPQFKRIIVNYFLYFLGEEIGGKLLTDNELWGKDETEPC